MSSFGNRNPAWNLPGQSPLSLSRETFWLLCTSRMSTCMSLSSQCISISCTFAVGFCTWLCYLAHYLHLGLAPVLALLHFLWHLHSGNSQCRLCWTMWSWLPRHYNSLDRSWTSRNLCFVLCLKYLCLVLGTAEASVFLRWNLTR